MWTPVLAWTKEVHRCVNGQGKIAVSSLSAVKACQIIVGARPTTSQLVVCIVMSLSYKP